MSYTNEAAVQLSGQVLEDARALAAFVVYEALNDVQDGNPGFGSSIDRMLAAFHVLGQLHAGGELPHGDPLRWVTRTDAPAGCLSADETRALEEVASYVLERGERVAQPGDADEVVMAARAHRVLDAIG
ncbi:MAG TPA: hypothetical protein VNT51_09965 [Miltoncostaeaceae bacterium]|nr:hypothetical protein [Miltoncostaeaceae bacterium]